MNAETPTSRPTEPSKKKTCGLYLKIEGRNVHRIWNKGFCVYGSFGG